MKLQRAEQLVGGLVTEEKRWASEAERLSDGLKNLVGNIMLAAGCISYIGPFTSDYRADLITVSLCLSTAPGVA